jgi:hypothetical protein
MGTRPRRQQTTEKIGEPLDLGIGTVYIERRNGSSILSARAYIQGKHKVWSTGKEDEKDARRKATEQFFALRRRIATGEHLHGHLFSEAVEKFVVYADTRQQRELSAGQRQQYHIKWGVLKKVLKKHFERHAVASRQKHSGEVHRCEVRRVVRARKPETLAHELAAVELYRSFRQQLQNRYPSCSCLSSSPLATSFQVLRGDHISGMTARCRVPIALTSTDEGSFQCLCVLR